jgi:hypothetical protein
MNNRRSFIQNAVFLGATLGVSRESRSDAVPGSPAQAPQPTYTTISGSAQVVLDRVDWKSFSGMKHIHGFNYQPSWGHDAGSVWLETFSAARYRHELETGKKYFPTFNCVRIWLGYGAYRKSRELLLRNFKAAIDVCTSLDLLVIPVLFTVWEGAPPFDPVAAKTLPTLDFEQAYGEYLRDIVTAQRGNRTILAWELCNEPNERDPIDPEMHAQARWLKFLHDRVKTIDPQARTCIGTVADFSWGQEVSQYCDLLTPHLYGYSLWKPRFDQGKVRADFATWFECMVDQYLARTEILTPGARPILSSETCWGSRDDDERKRIIKATLGVLKRYDIGFTPHALYESGVADLHVPENYEAVFGGVVANPAPMQFVNADGSLRPGHDVFNEFA